MRANQAFAKFFPMRIRRRRPHRHLPSRRVSCSRIYGPPRAAHFFLSRAILSLPPAPSAKRICAMTKQGAHARIIASRARRHYARLREYRGEMFIMPVGKWLARGKTLLRRSRCVYFIERSFALSIYFSSAPRRGSRTLSYPFARPESWTV